MFPFLPLAAWQDRFPPYSDGAGFLHLPDTGHACDFLPKLSSTPQALSIMARDAQGSEHSGPQPGPRAPLTITACWSSNMRWAQAYCRNPPVCVDPPPLSPWATPTSPSRLREMPASSVTHALTPLREWICSCDGDVMLLLVQLTFVDGEAHVVGVLCVLGTGCMVTVPLSPPNSPEGVTSSPPHER